jgi:hypothetical protein
MTNDERFAYRSIGERSPVVPVDVVDVFSARPVQLRLRTAQMTIVIVYNTPLCVFNPDQSNGDRR